jgi:mRNA interferase MazF
LLINCISSLFLNVTLVWSVIMEKDFDKWNEKKKIVNAKEVNEGLFYSKREIWWCSLGVNVGVETDGKHQNFERPVLILKKFNQHMFWGIPMTSRKKTGHLYQKVTYSGGVSWANFSQLKAISTKRLLRKITTISEDQFTLAREKLKSLI